MASDAKTVYSQQEHLQMKYVGTGQVGHRETFQTAMAAGRA